MIQESYTRSLVKAVSYRLLGSLATGLIVWLLSGETALAAAAGGLDLAAKLALYVLHERAWDRIRWGRREAPASVIWFTGLSGSGKTTLALRLVETLRRRGLKVEHLDGDGIRHLLPATGFSREDRDQHIRRVGLLASYLQKNGVTVVASLISPFTQSRNYVRELCPHFVEVYLSTPLEECERRDVKGLYARARRGEIRDFTGIDSPYEPPGGAEIELDTSRLAPDEALRHILREISRRTERGGALGFSRSTRSGGDHGTPGGRLSVSQAGLALFGRKGLHLPDPAGP